MPAKSKKGGIRSEFICEDGTTPQADSVKTVYSIKFRNEWHFNKVTEHKVLF